MIRLSEKQHIIISAYLNGESQRSIARGTGIYRTADNVKPAEFSSVATSICVVQEIRHISEFKDYNEFYEYLIKMLYNIALNKRPIRKELIEEVGLDRNERWVAVKLTNKNLLKIIELGDVDESFIIN